MAIFYCQTHCIYQTFGRYLLTILYIVSSSTGYMLGAPLIACDSRTPVHGFQAQTSSTPFSISQSVDSYTPGNYTKVTIDSSSYTSIKGFLIQARQGQLSGQLVGTWFPQVNANLLQCAKTSVYDSSTHINNEEKSLPFDLFWTPPFPGVGNVIFVATIVVSRDTFWIDTTSTLPENPPCDPTPCLYGGTCYQSANGDTYFCLCPSGYTGTHCEVVPVGPCSSTPCLNGAVCTQTSTGYQCQCTSGYQGTRCEINVNECTSSPCLNGGICIDEVNQFRCDCVSGFSGVRCDTVPVGHCSSSPCLNGAACTQTNTGYQCQCTSGYQGTRCDIDSTQCSSSPCKNNGYCTNVGDGFSCACINGYVGDTCFEIDFCRDSPCQNGARCVLYTTAAFCVCPNGYKGKYCDSNSESTTSSTDNPLIAWWWVALIASGGVCILGILVAIYCACKSDGDEYS